MATTKKTTVKKTAAKKAPVSKVSAKKSAPVKRAVSRRTRVAEAMRSFRVYREPVPFTTFKITRQTVYWIVLVAFIIFVQLWIIKLQVEVANLIDQQQQASSLITE